MSDRHSDPLHDLEHFEVGNLATAPLPPSEVRRLGDRHRSRRRNAVLASIAAVVIAAVVPVAVLTGHDKESAPNRIATTPDPTPTPGLSVVTYPGNGISISAPSDVAQLKGTSPAFRAFVADQVRQLLQNNTTCPASGTAITVKKYSTAGYAIGDVSDCGGYQALWAMTPESGIWSEALGTQDSWDCDALRYLGVPSSFAGDCYTYAGDFGPASVDGVRLGMTRAQVEAAGGSVIGSSGAPCTGLSLPHSPRPSAHSDGFLANDRVVAITARTGMKTAKKIGLGSTAAAVRAAYPGGKPSPYGGWRVALPGGTAYDFSMGSGTVQLMALVGPHQDPATSGACMS